MKSWKLYIQSLMRDEREDLPSRAMGAILSVISYAYGVLAGCHNFFYRVNLLKSHKPEIAVLSVGNITLGGTGKTPFVIMLSRLLAEKGKKVAVLIRGYGEDEWKMLEEKLTKFGVKVFVGRDRVSSAKKAFKEGFDAIILDDGFQHRRLKRDLDIVLIDSADPFGNRRLFPRGILRELPSSLARADFIILTKTDHDKADMGAVEERIKKIAPGKAYGKARHVPKELVEIEKGSLKNLALVSGKRVCIFSAICDPSYFRRTVLATNAQVESEFIFPDHYSYKIVDLDRIFKACKEKNIGTIITTEKDAVKLKGLKPGALGFKENGMELLALRVELELTHGKEKLNDEIHRLYMRHPHQGR